MQIIKDRVYDVANPQTISQMQQRVIFATVTSAAKHMFPLISISQEGETKPEYARQLFISQNVELLKRTIGKRVGLQRHYMSAFAPKGNQVIIPNSYQVSRGSLSLPDLFIPRTADGESVGTTFQYKEYKNIGRFGYLTIGQSYTAAEIWENLFGLKPGDQITFPQIYGSDSAQEMLDGSTVVDKTLDTTFVAPRIVLLSEMPSTPVVLTAQNAGAQVQAALLSGIDSEKSFKFENFPDFVEVDETQENNVYFAINIGYNMCFGIVPSETRAIGCILSRKDANGKWQYSTTNLCCVWDFISQDSGEYYFGFTLDNAISTYLPSAQTDENGNFLQRGGESDIVPESFG